MLIKDPKIFKPDTKSHFIANKIKNPKLGTIVKGLLQVQSFFTVTQRSG